VIVNPAKAVPDVNSAKFPFRLGDMVGVGVGDGVGVGGCVGSPEFADTGAPEGIGEFPPPPEHAARHETSMPTVTVTKARQLRCRMEIFIRTPLRYETSAHHAQQ